MRLGIFAAVIVLLAAVTRLVPHASRRRLRRSVLLFTLNIVVVLGAIATGSAGYVSVAEGFEIASGLLRVLLIINLSALALFDLLFPLARWDFPDILHDLVVGLGTIVLRLPGRTTSERGAKPPRLEMGGRCSRDLMAKPSLDSGL